MQQFFVGGGGGGWGVMLIFNFHPEGSRRVCAGRRQFGKLEKGQVGGCMFTQEFYVVQSEKVFISLASTQGLKCIVTAKY